MKIHLFLALLGESLRFSLQNVRANLLRTLLSLLGITIGVFCIISILTLVDSIEYNIRDSISRFGNNILFVQKWPWVFDSSYPWWKYQSRPEVKYSDLQQLQKRFKEADAIAFNVWIPEETVKYEDNTIDGIIIRAVSHEQQEVMEMDFMTGRYFTEFESQRGDPVAILGYDLAETLFKTPAKALDKQVDIMGRRLKVIGVLNKQGNGLGLGNREDRQATVPVNFVRALGNFEGQLFNTSLLIKGKEGINADVLEDDLRGVMRSIRRLSPRQEDNFAINQITMLSSFLTALFGKISLYGWIIAGFSILVGGFGIANIMFVSVKERTSIIGIQKALGAKNYFILIQFLGEAIILCLLGGLIGLTLIFILTSLLNLVLPLQLILTFKNIMLGIGISSLIGVLSGFVPSQQAARMDPIEAIRFNM